MFFSNLSHKYKRKRNERDLFIERLSHFCSVFFISFCVQIDNNHQTNRHENLFVFDSSIELSMTLKDLLLIFSLHASIRVSMNDLFILLIDRAIALC
jgi:hypothetical protein